MPDYHEELRQTFRKYSDSEIIGKLRAGTLIELAQQVAKAELAARGIEYQAATPPPPSKPEAATEAFSGYITVANCYNVAEAEILRGRLEEEGIPAFLPDAHLGQANRL